MGREEISIPATREIKAGNGDTRDRKFIEARVLQYLKVKQIPWKRVLTEAVLYSDKIEFMFKYLNKSLLLILFAFILIPLEGQNESYSQGYIITLEGDTLEGQVKDRSGGTFTTLYSRIRFKAENSLFKKKYGPDQILGYACGNQMYESLPLVEENTFFKFRYYVNQGNERVFLRVVLKNEALTYYHWEYIEEDNNYLDYIPLFYRNGYNEMVRVSQGVLGLKKKQLIAYFRDCPELVHAIENKELKEIPDVYYFFLDKCVNQ